jgi:magnesium-transporting ATPase (P-type)
MLLPQLAIGATIAVAAMPEGMPLLTRVSEAGVARRLAARDALTRRLPAVEALGRVDVACADKTGTLTQGRLALRLLAEVAPEGAEAEVPLPTGHELPSALRAVLRAAALASPGPDAADAAAHPTDAAVVRGAEDVGLGAELRAPREAELPFDPLRAFYATAAGRRLYVKGAPEALASRCALLRTLDGDLPLDAARQSDLLTRAEALATRGLRVLLVAERGDADIKGAEREGPGEALEDPHDLVALGFVGIADPLKPTVPAAVRRCHEAGVRVVMLTGDHPATARAIAHEAGLLDGVAGAEEALLTGAEIAELQNGELDARLERAVVIARATPLDKVRIVESLQRRGHTVAMTGDGVNDAPALRLADVGVAMGQGGTEVARQTADVVLADDEFATLVETFVEGRSFWRNIRRAIGLLLGGNLGELGLVVGATALGFAAPLTARQILVVNMITDMLPGLAVTLQQPEHRNLAALAREGASALDIPLRNDILRRGAFTAVPSLAAYLLSLASGSPPEASTVAFASVVATQLAQTLDVGRAEGHLTAPVLGAVAGSAGLLGSAIVVPPLRRFLGLAVPGPLGWALVGGGALTALALSRLLTPLSPASPAARSTLRLLPPPAR